MPTRARLDARPPRLLGWRAGLMLTMADERQVRFSM